MLLVLSYSLNIPLYIRRPTHAYLHISTTAHLGLFVILIRPVIRTGRRGLFAPTCCNQHTLLVYAEYPFRVHVGSWSIVINVSFDRSWFITNTWRNTVVVFTLHILHNPLLNYYIVLMLLYVPTLDIPIVRWCIYR